ncbi:hypothetical protein E4T56_gene10768 [Termitomyces sp. T112]|nr:hypothetical protein E4T56_gene10768 [Termitomyces sp. T112]
MADLASQLEKITMAHAFLNQVDHLLSLIYASLAKNPHLAVTTIFQIWLQWFKTVGSGVEWPELANIKKECHQLYEQYKREEWVCSFDVHFEVAIGGSRIAKGRSRELVESDEESNGNDGSDNNSNNDMPLAQKQPTSPTLVTSAKQPQTIASEEASDMKVKGEEEFEAAPVTMEEDKGAGEVKGTWSDTPLWQVSNDELEWLGKDLAWLMLLMPVASLADFDKRAAGVEQWFQRKLEAAREELIAVRAWYAVAKQTLVTLVGYWHDCQAFLTWQEENNISKGY